MHAPEPALTTRRTFLTLVAQCTAAGILGCGEPTAAEPSHPSRLTFRTGRPSGSVAHGLQPLGLDPFRDGALYVPASYTPSEPLPLVVLLHGAGASGADWFGSYGPRADAARVVLLAPDCRFFSWDAISNAGNFSEDVAFISAAITAIFTRCAIDAHRMALFGFSDGASYALALGLANGDRLRHTAAFSPGFIPGAPRHGTPDFFIAHGLSDSVHPIEQTSRVIVPELRAAGYQVDYTEFAGAHELPSQISSAGFDWLASRF
jgi:phospholipase/carboxylesterase